MRYEYDVETETFRRIDGRGRALEFNITEAKRIESLRNLGFSVQKIYDKIDFANDVSITNLRTFIRNLESGELSTEGDYPAPAPVIKDLDLEARVQRLEEKMANSHVPVRKITDKRIIDKVKSWLMS